MKLHIGGKQAKEGWTIFNIQKMDYVDIVGDIRDLSQFQDESLEIIYASHVLEHVSQKEVPETLRGIHSCLLYTSPSPRDDELSRMPSSA